jgi:hypothetical protein
MQLTTVKFLAFLFLYKFIKSENLLMTYAKLLLSINSKSIDIRKLLGEDSDEFFY